MTMQCCYFLLFFPLFYFYVLNFWYWFNWERQVTKYGTLTLAYIIVYIFSDENHKINGLMLRTFDQQWNIKKRKLKNIVLNKYNFKDDNGDGVLQNGTNSHNTILYWKTVHNNKKRISVQKEIKTFNSRKKIETAEQLRIGFTCLNGKCGESITTTIARVILWTYTIQMKWKNQKMRD